NELTDVVAAICRARHEALGLQLDLLGAYEDGGDIEDLTLRRRWLHAARDAIAAHSVPDLQSCSIEICNSADLLPPEGDLQEEAASVLHESLRLELSDTPLPTCLASALS